MSQSVSTSSKNTSKKAKAILAGGVVLGVGAVVTLAAWTDQEWASGDFRAGSFNVESSVDGETFKDHEGEGKGGAAALEFKMSPANNLSPDDTTAAPFVLRLDDETTYGAEVSLKNTSLTGGNATGLTYGITRVDSVDACNANLNEGVRDIVEKGTPLGQKPATSKNFTLVQGTDGAPGKEAILCFQITADDNLSESQTATATWAFDAVSQ